MISNKNTVLQVVYGSVRNNSTIHFLKVSFLCSFSKLLRQTRQYRAFAKGPRGINKRAVHQAKQERQQLETALMSAARRKRAHAIRTLSEQRTSSMYNDESRSIQFN